MYRSPDNGVTWEKIDNRIFNGDIYQMQFLNDNTGFVLSADYGSGVASSGLFKTENGGETWTRNATLMNSNGAFCFINESTGLFCYEGIGITIAKTEDAGETWTSTDFTDISLSPYVMKFFNDNNGMIAGEGPILRTTDAGETWQEIYWNSETYEGISDIFYKSENEVYITGRVVGLGTFVGKSVNGGETWEITGIGNYGGGKNIVFTDENTAFIACGSTAILKSTDGGETWTETAVNTSNYIEFKQLSFPSENTGYAVGEGNYENFFMTTDGGETWNPVNTDCSASFNSLHFFDESNGLVGGGMGVLFSISNELIQFNPPQNIDGWQEYICPMNIFHITWDAPDTANTGNLIAYKVYRNALMIDSIPVTGFYGYGIADTLGGGSKSVSSYDFYVCYYVSAVYDNPFGESEPTEKLSFNQLIINAEENKIQQNGFLITPNPAFDEIAVHFSSQTGENSVITVFDISGKIMIKEKIDYGRINLSIDVSRLKEGLYFLSIKTGGKSITKKFIKAGR
jgi:photosystem II stability/assembly factor-like uncharacterized protein